MHDRTGARLVINLGVFFTEYGRLALIKNMIVESAFVKPPQRIRRRPIESDRRLQTEKAKATAKKARRKKKVPSIASLIRCEVVSEI